MRLPSDEDTLDLQLLAQHDDVGGRAGLDPADVRADHPRGNGGGGVERRLERDAERVEVPDSFDHRQHAPGEDTVAVATDDAVPDLDGHVPQPVRAVAADARGGDSV